MGPSGALPARGQGASLGETGRGLDTDDGALVELLQCRRARVGARRPHTRGDRVDEVLDAGPGRVEGHPRRRDALLEQALARPLVPVVGAGTGADRALRGHAEGLLVRAALLVVAQIAWRLVGAREPRTDHRRRRAGG